MSKKNPHSLAIQRVSITVRDRAHFYALVHWCNNNIGYGSSKWTVAGRVLRFVDPSKKSYNPPIVRDWLVFVPDIDLTPLLAL